MKTSEAIASRSSRKRRQNASQGVRAAIAVGSMSVSSAEAPTGAGPSSRNSLASTYLTLAVLPAAPRFPERYPETAKNTTTGALTAGLRELAAHDRVPGAVGDQPTLGERQAGRRR